MEIRDDDKSARNGYSDLSSIPLIRVNDIGESRNVECEAFRAIPDVPILGINCDRCDRFVS